MQLLNTQTTADYISMDKHRVNWASRRGMLELDLFLVPFVEERYEQLDEADQFRYQKLLTCEDQDLLSWVLQRSSPEDEDLKRILKLIYEHRYP